MDIKMDYNYHTHTPYCRHASNTAEDYVLRATHMGVTHMGFSDHAPFRQEDGFGLYWRVQTEELESYISELRDLREKYRDKIDLKIGFEMEYYRDSFEKMLGTAAECGGEYLILGQHFVSEDAERSPVNVHTVQPSDSEEKLRAYADTVSEGIRTGKFTYVAHPDIMNFTGDIELYREEMRKICVASKECGVPLEINFLGIRDMRNYPREDFWQLAGEIGSPVTFGFDAHRAVDAFDGGSLEKALALVGKYGLNYIGRPKVVSIK